MSNKASVVLVHGAWADGSSWAKVIALLAAEGIKAVAAPLPLTSFADDVAAHPTQGKMVNAPGPLCTGPGRSALECVARS